MPLYKIIFYSFIIVCFSMLKSSGQAIGPLKEALASSKGLAKITLLHQLNVAYQKTNLDSSALYGHLALKLSQKVAHDSLIGISHARLCLSHYLLRQMDSLLFYSQAGQITAKKLRLNKMLAYFIKMEVIAHNHNQNFEQSIAKNLEALEIYETLHDSLGLAACYSNLGRSYQMSGVYDQALAYYLKAEQIFEVQGDQYGSIITTAQIGDLYLDMKNAEKGLLYTKKALALTNRDSMPIEYADFLNVMGTIYHTDSSLLQLDSAMNYFSEALLTFTKIGDKEGEAMSHNNVGNLYRDVEKWQKCFFHLHEAKNSAFFIKNKKTLINSYTNLGLAHQAQGNVDSTAYYFLKAYAILEKETFPFEEEGLLENLYFFYKKNKQPQKALHYYELFVAHLEKTKSEKVQKKVLALEKKYESAKKEREIERLALQNEIQSSKTNAFRISLIGLFIFSFLLILGMLYRRRNEQKLYILKQKIHEQEKKDLANELQFKTKQLTSHALQMVQKNKTLQELKSSLATIANKAPAEEKKALQAMIRRIDFNIRSDEDWNTFKLYFEQTHHGFYQNLAKVNDKLSPTELKLCALIKLNMNIKETAAVLNIEPTSVKTARHRLRKKLNINQGDDLAVFMRNVA